MKNDQADSRSSPLSEMQSIATSPKDQGKGIGFGLDMFYLRDPSWEKKTRTMKAKAKGRDAYHRAGIRAKKLGITRDSNPYASGTKQHAHWRSGWDSHKIKIKTIDKLNETGSM